jgi:hypothetical protein
VVPSSPPVTVTDSRITLIPGVAVNGSTVGASREPGEVSMTGSSAAASIWYTYTAPSDGTLALSTAGSSFDTLLGLYAYTNAATTPLSTLTNVRLVLVSHPRWC